MVVASKVASAVGWWLLDRLIERSTIIGIVTVGANAAGYSISPAGSEVIVMGLINAVGCAAQMFTPNGTVVTPNKGA